MQARFLFGGALVAATLFRIETDIHFPDPSERNAPLILRNVAEQQLTRCAQRFIPHASERVVGIGETQLHLDGEVCRAVAFIDALSILGMSGNRPTREARPWEYGLGALVHRAQTIGMPAKPYVARLEL